MRPIYLGFRYLLFAGLLIVLDQLSKVWVVNTLPLGGPRDPLVLGFHLTYVQNTGAAFGIFQNVTLLLALLSAFVVFGIVVYLLRHAHTTPKLLLSSLTLILSGAAGNLIDRVRLGYVIDFIDFYVPGVIDFAIFNVADSCVVIGAGLLLLSSFTSRHKAPQPPTRAEPADALEGHLDSQSNR